MQFPQMGIAFFHIKKLTMKERSSTFRLSSTAKERLKLLALETKKDMTKVLELAIMQFNPNQLEQDIIIAYNIVQNLIEVQKIDSKLIAVFNNIAIHIKATTITHLPVGTLIFIVENGIAKLEMVVKNWGLLDKQEKIFFTELLDNEHN